MIDQRRILSSRNACLPCIQTKTNQKLVKTSTCLERCRPIAKYAEILTFIPIKIVVILCTLGILALSIVGNYNITEEFDPWLFLDPKSYVSQFKQAQDRFFPDEGQTVLLFFSGNITKGNNDFQVQIFNWVGRRPSILSVIGSNFRPGP